MSSDALPRSTSTEAGEACGGCTLQDALQDALHASAVIERREFMRAGALALASLGMIALGSRAASAMRVEPMSALPPSGGDLRHERRYVAPLTDGVSIDKDNSVIIARTAGKVYAFSLACPHQNTALRWDEADKEFLCPKHKSHYRADGTFIEGRSTRDMDRLAVRQDGQGLVVDVDVLFQQDLNLAQWTAAFVPAQ